MNILAEVAIERTHMAQTNVHPLSATDRLLETLARCMMKRTSKIVLLALTVTIGLLTVFGWHLYP